jgi:hypothetical protein
MVERRLGVGHRHERAVSANGSRARTRLNGLGGLTARLTQVRVQVHKTRSHPTILRVNLERARGGRNPLGDVGNAPVAYQHVGDSGRRRAHYLSLAQYVHHDVFSSGVPVTVKYSAAMRIGTPLLTWRSMTAAGESATAESISTPRFIGPGCMMME